MDGWKFGGILDILRHNVKDLVFGLFKLGKEVIL